ncbi:MAG: CBS domain-containing protein [Pseudomonadota bacterium]
MSMGLLASEIMSKKVITARPDTGLRELAELLVLNNIGGMPVVDEEGELVGVVSQSDLIAQNILPHVPKAVSLFDWVIYLGGQGRLEAELEKIAGTTVGDIMTREVITVDASTPLEDVATIMTEKGIHTIPVLEEGRLAGVIGKLDIVRSLLT